MIKLNEKRSPWLISFIVALLYFVFYNATRYAMHESFQMLEALAGAAVFFVVYFFLQGYVNKKFEKKEIKKTKKKQKK